MSWNNWLERKKFDMEWEKIEMEYKVAGMSSEAIEEMRSFDWELFKQRRISAIHEQALVASSFDDDDSDDTHSALFKKFLNVLSTSDENSSSHSRHWWIEEIDNPELAANLKNLSVKQFELVSLIACDGLSQAEIARAKGIARQSLNEQIQQIKKIIKKS